MNRKSIVSKLSLPLLSVLFTAVCVTLLITAYKSNDFYIKYHSANAEIVTDTNSNTTLININTADISQLTEIPGIGEVLATRIIEYRESYGAFVDISEITSVQGIGDATFEKIKGYITV